MFTNSFSVDLINISVETVVLKRSANIIVYN